MLKKNNKQNIDKDSFAYKVIKSFDNYKDLLLEHNMDRATSKTPSLIIG